MPLTFFAFPATQIDPVAVHFRKTAGAGVKATKSALRYFEELQRITGRLMEESRRRPIGLRPVTAPVTGMDIEEIAVYARDELGIPRDQPVNTS